MPDATPAGVLEPSARGIAPRGSVPASGLSGRGPRASPLPLFALASLGYFSITVFRAQRRLFWFYEIFTFYIPRVPDMRSIWRACQFRRGSFVSEPATSWRIGKRPASKSFSIMASARGGDPIILADSLEFAPKFYYASLRSRFGALIPQGSLEGDLRLQQCCGVPGTVSSQSTFLASHRTFFVYGLEFLLPYYTGMFQQLGGQLTNQACDADIPQRCLLRFEFPDAQSGLSAAPGPKTDTKPRE